VTSLADREDLAGNRRRWHVAEDDLFDLVEAIVDLVGHVEVAVDDHVEERPQEEALFGGAVLDPLQLEAARHLVEVDLRALVTRVSDGDQPARSGDDVDLPAHDRAPGALAVVDRDVEVVAVAHQLGAFAWVEDGVDHGGTEPELFAQTAELVLGG
jgi:hypothetical protein